MKCEKFLAIIASIVTIAAFLQDNVDEEHKEIQQEEIQRMVVLYDKFQDNGSYYIIDFDKNIYKVSKKLYEENIQGDIIVLKS